MSAVAELNDVEKEIRDMKNAAAAEFLMPRPGMGQCVTWYANGTRNGPGEMAFVIGIGRRNIVIRTATGMPMESVRHIDDPKLSLNAEQRASGAWDFTERDKQIDSLSESVEALKARIQSLEDLLNEPAKKAK